jgi:UDP-glucose 4-epimerase
VSRDFLYVEDVAEAFELAALHTGPERIFNIGSGIPRSLNEIIKILELITGKPVDIDRHEGRRLDVPVSALEIRRAEQALGWTPRTDFVTGLRRTFSWAQTQQNHFELPPIVGHPSLSLFPVA